MKRIFCVTGKLYLWIETMIMMITPLTLHAEEPFKNDRKSLLNRYEKLLQEYEKLLQEMEKIEGVLISVTEDDLKKAPLDPTKEKQGLIRLLPMEATLMNDNLTERSVYSRLTETYSFSFARASHGFSETNLELNDGELVVPYSGEEEPFHYGYMTDTGETDLLKVDLDHKALEALLELEPHKTKKDFLIINDPWEFKKNGFIYKIYNEIKLGKVYVLRSINYNLSDLIVLVQPIRRDEEDDSIVIAWKILKEFEPIQFD